MLQSYIPPTVQKHPHKYNHVQQQYQHKYIPKIGQEKNKVKRNIATPDLDEIYKLQQKKEKNQRENIVEHSSEEKQISWSKQWYPLQVLMHLDSSGPTKMQLLGKDLVVWRDANNKWICQEDKRPNPLNGKEGCVKIPEFEAETTPKLRSNDRNFAYAHPTQEKFGLLFVWGESGPLAHLESILKPPVAPPIIHKMQHDPKNWMFLTLPYSFETLLENILDPSHIEVTHHGQQGFDRDNAKPIYLKLNKNNDDGLQNGFQIFRLNKKNQKIPEGEVFDLEDENFPLGDVQYMRFWPPNVVEHYAIGKTTNSIVQFAAPITKGKVTYFQAILFHGKKGKKQGAIMNAIPKWLFHQNVNLFFQQDNVFLNKQEKIIQNLPNPKTKNYFMPTLADQGVAELHKWLTKFAHGGVQYCSEMHALELTYEDVIDTYNNHTKNCGGMDCMCGMCDMCYMQCYIRTLDSR